MREKNGVSCPASKAAVLLIRRLAEIPTAIHPGGSIGNHKQESGDDMNYIINGTGKAFCDGVEEELKLA